MGLLGTLTAWTRGDTKKRDAALDALNLLSTQRFGTFGTGSVTVTQESARRHSAVWACRRLRADLESTLPVDVYRRVAGIQVEVSKTAFLEEPAPGVGWTEWAYSGRDALDGWGNNVGVITSLDGQGKPRFVELAPPDDTHATIKDGRVVEWRICGEKYKPEQIWHERQFTVAGSPIGLNPVLYAASSIGAYLSAQKYGNDYFGAGGAPTGTLRNVDVPNPPAEVIEAAKARFRAATSNRDIFVTGSSWEWTPAQAEAAASAFLEEMKFGAADACRFYGTPADMVDAGTSSSAVTYANVTQRNLQFLILHMGPAVIRREEHVSRVAMPAPRFIKLNTDALLRMDPQTRSDMINSQVGVTRTPSEGRALDNLPPFTDADWAELERFKALGRPSPTPAPTAGSGA